MSHAPTAPPPLARLAELVHERAREAPEAAVVTVTYRATDLEIGFWPIPEGIDHPTDVLIGWHAPHSCHVLGMITAGWATPVPSSAGQPHHFVSSSGCERVRITALLARDGTSATIIGSEEVAGAEPRVLSEAPLGWGADALARSLGRPTPAPTVTVGECIEAAWLAAIDRRIWPDGRYPPAPLPSWDEIALLHPLAPMGPPLPGALLAMEVQGLERESNWARMRLLFGRDQGRRPRVHPPGGTSIPLVHWFDDGSFARWSERHHPSVSDLLFDVLDLLPESVGRHLVDALTTDIAPHLLGYPFGLDEDACPCTSCTEARIAWQDEEDDSFDHLRDWVDPCGEG